MEAERRAGTPDDNPRSSTSGEPSRGSAGGGGPDPTSRVSLLAKFGILSMVPIVLLGIVLAQSLSGFVRSRALANARQAASIAARLGIQPRLSEQDLRSGLGQKRLQSLDRALRSAVLGHEVARIKIWSRGGRVVYSDDADLIGRRFPASDELEEALHGEVASEV